MGECPVCHKVRYHITKCDFLGATKFETFIKLLLLSR